MMQDHDSSERMSLALIFLISFTALSLVALWLIYQQFAQVFTRGGQCRVLAVQTRSDTIDLDNPAGGAQQYAITFTISLLTPAGERLRVPGYYTSANYLASDQATLNAIERRYPVGKAASCGYTYLDPSGIKAIFEPSLPLEGFFFPGFFLLVSLIIVILCLRAMRRGASAQIPGASQA
ncbi:MAG TPA: hypothetical protein VGF67_25450 [Ktedonobacteraceae bacterium]|jgi:hypothetical protein